MTTTAAENRAGEKVEKVEKRRALGRGLESLLPGPRAVRPGGPANSGGDGDAGTRAEVPAPHALAPHGAGPHVPRAHGVGGEAIEGKIRAEVGVDVVEGTRAGVPAPHAPAPHGPGADETSAATHDSSGVTDDSTITILAQADTGRVPGNLVVNLAIEDIDKNPFQTRYVDDNEALEELANSIKANGVVQPILVRPAEQQGRYILVLGERRLHASKKAGKTTIPSMVRKISPQQAAEMTIIENLQREDLSPLEQAQAFKVLSQDFAMTQAHIAERVGLSRESVTNYMRLLRLPREVMQMLAEKRISFAQAKELLKLNNDDDISRAALFAVNKGYSLDQVERMVLSMEGLLPAIPGLQPKTGTEKKTGTARWVDPNVRAAQIELERMLGVRVRIRDRKGKGRIVIEYSTVDDYERVVDALRGTKS